MAKKWLQKAKASMKRRGTEGSLTRIAKAQDKTPTQYCEDTGWKGKKCGFLKGVKSFQKKAAHGLDNDLPGSFSNISVAGNPAFTGTSSPYQKPSVGEDDLSPYKRARGYYDFGIDPSESYPQGPLAVPYSQSRDQMKGQYAGWDRREGYTESGADMPPITRKSGKTKQTGKFYQNPETGQRVFEKIKYDRKGNPKKLTQQEWEYNYEYAEDPVTGEIIEGENLPVSVYGGPNIAKWKQKRNILGSPKGERSEVIGREDKPGIFSKYRYKHGADEVDDNQNNIEVEGDELALERSPNGRYWIKEDFKGPSHDEGGIDYKAEAGTIIIPKYRRDEVVRYLKNNDFTSIDSVKKDLDEVAMIDEAAYGGTIFKKKKAYGGTIFKKPKAAFGDSGEGPIGDWFKRIGTNLQERGYDRRQRKRDKYNTGIMKRHRESEENDFTKLTGQERRDYLDEMMGKQENQDDRNDFGKNLVKSAPTVYNLAMGALSKPETYAPRTYDIDSIVRPIEEYTYDIDPELEAIERKGSLSREQFRNLSGGSASTYLGGMSNIQEIESGQTREAFANKNRREDEVRLQAPGMRQSFEEGQMTRDEIAEQKTERAKSNKRDYFEKGLEYASALIQQEEKNTNQQVDNEFKFKILKSIFPELDELELEELMKSYTGK